MEGRPHGLPPSTPCYTSNNKSSFIVILNENLGHIQVGHFTNTTIVNVTIRKEEKEEALTVVSQYSPPSANLCSDLEEWDAIPGLTKDWLVLGDFNAHSVLWGYPSDDDKGSHLIDFIHRNHLIVINDPHCTPTFQTDHAKGWPDVSMASFSLYPRINFWSVEEDLNYGDHRLITIETDIQISKLPLRRYRTKNTSFKKFSKCLKDAFNQQKLNFKTIRNTDEFDTEYNKLVTMIIEVSDKSLKKKKSSFTPTITWWNNDLRRNRNYVKALQRKQKNPNSTLEEKLKYKKERAKYRQNILKSKRAAWISFCEKSKDPFGKVKKVAFQEFFRQEATALSTSMATTHTRATFYQELTENIFGESQKPSVPKLEPDDSAPPFIIQELKAAIYSFNKNKAPGPDQIDHIIIRKIYTLNPTILLEMYNSLLKLNYFPPPWKVGELVYFHKTDRPRDDYCSYRPITLLPILGKIYEKMLLKRIHHNLENSKLLEPSQHGFMEGKSTETALKDLFSKIESKSYDSNYISLISLDFQQAFDNLPWDATIEELEILQVKKPYRNIIKSFLSLRGIYNNWLARNIHWLRKGCPQGSCLGPFLWRVFVNELLRQLRTHGFQVIAYADDILLIISGKTRRQLEQLANQALQLVSDWAREHQMTISYDKCAVLHLNKPKHLKRAPTYKIDNHTLKSEKTLLYLGITLDPTLSFLPHLRNKRFEIVAITQNLLRFSSSSTRLSKSILKIWYKTILERKVAYASSIWFPQLQKSHGYRIISSIQAHCLLTISKAYKKTATAALCVLTGLAPLHLQLQKESIQGNVLRLNTPYQDYDPKTFQTAVSSAGIRPFQNYLNRLKDLTEPSIIKYHIYTDGSKTDTGTAFAFCVYDSQNHLINEHSSKINQENSVYQSELLAISTAIEWADIALSSNIAIHTDSLSSLQALEDFTTRDYLVQKIIKQLQNTRNSYFFHWVKGHSGQTGNEHADSLAKSATEPTSKAGFIYCPLPPSFLKSSLKRELILNWQQEWDYGDTGRLTHKLLPKVTEDLLLPHRNLYLALTNHGPFPEYLHKIHKADSEICTCGVRGSSLHYILSCPLTSTFHIRKPRNHSLAQWFAHVIKKPELLNKIIQCMNLLEQNQHLFQLPPPL